MKKLITILAIIVTLSACTDTTSKRVSMLRVGMTEKEVVELMDSEPYHVTYRSNGPVYKYRYRSPEYIERVYIYFKGGKVESFY